MHRPGMNFLMVGLVISRVLPSGRNGILGMRVWVILSESRCAYDFYLRLTPSE